MVDSHRRSLAKAVTWRLLGSVDTLVIDWIITGRFVVALSISGVELFTKVALFWLNERVWHRLSWGRTVG